MVESFLVPKTSASSLHLSCKGTVSDLIENPTCRSGHLMCKCSSLAGVGFASKFVDESSNFVTDDSPWHKVVFRTSFSGNISSPKAEMQCPASMLFVNLKGLRV